MAMNSNATDCISTEEQTNEPLPISPFTSLKLHFGMLLGVEDLETLEAYPRGKMRLHNAWLHGHGVVWGLGVDLKADRGEIQVSPGLALDGRGHELHLDVPMCVNLASWYQTHQNDPDLVVAKDASGSVSFDTYVVVRFKACLTRPVPAMASSCDGATTDTAYSRAHESVELFLRARSAEATPRPYHRLRLLFGLDEPRDSHGSPDPADLAIVVRAAEIRQNHLPSEQPKLLLAAFREYAALDVIDLVPTADEDGVRTLFPNPDPDEIVLAKVTAVILEPITDGFKLGTPAPTVVTTIRPSLVATSTLQELLNGPMPLDDLVGTGGSGTGSGANASIAVDAGGPRIDQDTVTRAAKILTFKTIGRIEPSSVDIGAFRVTSFDEQDGWTNIECRDVSVVEDTVTLHLHEELPTGLVRLIVNGTGPFPILGLAPGYVPLAGAKGGSPGTAYDGHDFVYIWKTRS